MTAVAERPRTPLPLAGKLAESLVFFVRLRGSGSSGQRLLATRPLPEDEVYRRVLTQCFRYMEPLSGQVRTIEKSIDEMRLHRSNFECDVAADLLDIEQTIRAQSTAIDSARVSIVQTDDLMECVVEALEALQTVVLDEHEIDGDQLVFAVN